MPKSIKPQQPQTIEEVYGLLPEVACKGLCKEDGITPPSYSPDLVCDKAMRRLSAHSEVLPPVPSALYLGHDSELFNITRLLIEESNYRFQF